MQDYPNVADGIKQTGTYANRAKQQYELWAVNQRTGEQRLLGTCGYELPREWFQNWERRMWRRFMYSAG